jgi:outer membrane lipoprotein-sorting protein
MRWFAAVFCCAVVVSTAQAQQSAQELYEAMEQRLAKADALRFNFESEFQQGGVTFKQKGALLLAAGNRMHLALETRAETPEGKQQTTTTLLVSDGKKLAGKSNVGGMAQTETGTADTHLCSSVVRYVSRHSLWFALALVKKLPDPKVVSLLTVSGFKTVGKEKVDKREANVIEYQLAAFPGAKDTTTWRLWLDAETNLPLKRTFADTKDGKTVRITETYNAWELNPKVTAEAFDLPK